MVKEVQQIVLSSPRQIVHDAIGLAAVCVILVIGFSLPGLF